MKKLLFLLVFIPFVSFSQQWKFSYVGNAFDGFYRLTGIDLIDYSSYIVIINKSEELKLRWGDGGENTI